VITSHSVVFHCQLYGRCVMWFGTAGILRTPAAGYIRNICLDHIGTWRQEYFVCGVYN